MVGIDRLYNEYSWRLTRRAKKVWQSGMVVGNKSNNETKKFENSIAKYTKRKYAVAVGSGTDALYFALKVKGIGPGSTVLCPAVSYMATAEAIKRTGAIIQFCDVNENGLIDHIPMMGLPSAVVYVNLFGNLADYDRIQKYCTKHGIPLIEDAAQSLGSFYKKIPSGKLGDVSTLSFAPSKPLPAFGNAGMVLTDSFDEAEKLRGLRYHGYNNVNVSHGYNSCIPESVASQLDFLLGKYSSLLKKRNNIYKIYTEELSKIHDIEQLKYDPVSNKSKFVIRVPNRDELQGYLFTKGIETAITYKTPLPKMKMFQKAIIEEEKFINAEKFCEQVISLPIHPFLKKEEVKYVCKQIKDFYV